MLDWLPKVIGWIAGIALFLLAADRRPEAQKFTLSCTGLLLVGVLLVAGIVAFQPEPASKRSAPAPTATAPATPPNLDASPLITFRNPRLLALLFLLNLPAYVAIWRIFLGRWDDFREALYYLVSPDAWDWGRGEGLEDAWANLKLFWFAVTCALLVISEYLTLLRWRPEWI